MLTHKKVTLTLIALILAAGMIAGACLLLQPIRITEIDDAGDLSHLFEDVLLAEFSSHNASLGTAFEEDISAALDMLKQVRLNPDPISVSRAEDRDMTHTIRLHYNGTQADACLCFNESFTELWLNDGVKPSYSYAVKNPEIVEAYFDQLDPFTPTGTLPSGDWVSCFTYGDSDTLRSAYIILWDDPQSFEFVWSLLSSYIAKGSYKLTADTLVLKTGDGLYTYTFRVKDDSTLVFDEANSSPLPEYVYTSGGAAETPVPDGAEFTLGE